VLVIPFVSYETVLKKKIQLRISGIVEFYRKIWPNAEEEDLG